MPEGKAQGVHADVARASLQQPGAATRLFKHGATGSRSAERLKHEQGPDWRLDTRHSTTVVSLRRVQRAAKETGNERGALASLAGITRQKVIAIEKGDLSVGVMAYARVLAALDSELNVVPAAMPTLDEIHGVFD